MQHIYIETIHYAHICLVRDNPPEGVDEADLVNAITEEVLAKHDASKVKVDERFCCNVLTEVGLIGSCKDSVRLAAEEIYSKAIITGSLKGFSY